MTKKKTFYVFYSDYRKKAGLATEAAAPDPMF